MKAVLVVAFMAVPAFALKPPLPLPAACGPQNVFFSVKLDKSQHTSAHPEPGKATVYLIAPHFGMGTLTERIGMDGAWVGANKSTSWINGSWFSISVVPGEHHVCAQIQPTSDRLMDNPVELAHFNAEAGKVYYFLGLDLTDSDEAKYLIASFHLSISHPKK